MAVPPRRTGVRADRLPRARRDVVPRRDRRPDDGLVRGWKLAPARRDAGIPAPREEGGGGAAGRARGDRGPPAAGSPPPPPRSLLRRRRPPPRRGRGGWRAPPGAPLARHEPAARGLRCR